MSFGKQQPPSLLEHLASRILVGSSFGSSSRIWATLCSKVSVISNIYVCHWICDKYYKRVRSYKLKFDIKRASSLHAGERLNLMLSVLGASLIFSVKHLNHTLSEAYCPEATSNSQAQIEFSESSTKYILLPMWEQRLQVIERVLSHKGQQRTSSNNTRIKNRPLMSRRLALVSFASSSWQSAADLVYRLHVAV